MYMLRSFANIFKAHPAISYCCHLRLKCSDYKYFIGPKYSLCVKNVFEKKSILVIFWIFKYGFYYSFTLKEYAIFNTEQHVDNTFRLKPWLKSISVGSNFSHLANVLATTF